MKILRFFLTTFKVLLGFFALSYGGCEIIKYNASGPVREMCTRNIVGSPFSAAEFAANGMTGPLIKSIQSEPPVNVRSPLGVIQAKVLDDRHLSGVASLTISAGFPKRTCKVSFADGKVTAVTLGPWWD